MNRRHDYMPEGYAMLNVDKLPDGTFEGRIDIGHVTRRFAGVVEITETVTECCERLEKRFSEIMSEHQCGSGCTTWQLTVSVAKPSGTVQ
jgi:hypothetical protein